MEAPVICCENEGIATVTVTLLNREYGIRAEVLSCPNSTFDFCIMMPREFKELFLSSCPRTEITPYFCTCVLFGFQLLLALWYPDWLSQKGALTSLFPFFSSQRNDEREIPQHLGEAEKMKTEGGADCVWTYIKRLCSKNNSAMICTNLASLDKFIYIHRVIIY